MVTEIPGKGRGVVSAKDIKIGEQIFIDKPVIEEVNAAKWQANKETEVMLLMKKIENLPSEARLQFYLLKGDGGKSFEDLQKNYNANVGEIGATVDLFFKNARIVDHVMTFSLYLNMALVNHSCAPNADVGKLLEKDEDGKQYNRIEIRAIKDISKGEEITFSYLNILTSGSTEARKRYIKEEHNFVCHCDACSFPNRDQEIISLKLMVLLQALSSGEGVDHYKKGLSEWAKDAENIDKFNDLMQKFQLGNSMVRCTSMISLAKTAQLARNQDLVKKGLDMFKKFSEDIKIEEIGLVYEKLDEDLTLWSNNLKSKDKPRRNEIECFLTENLLKNQKPTFYQCNKF